MSKDTIEINVEELKQEVKEELRAIERDRITPRPVQRIGEILDLLRRYMGAVVRANAPRQFSPGMRNVPKQRALLRAHREARRADGDPKTGLVPLRAKLKALDCTFVLAGEVAWRVEELDWEMKLWKPLHRWVEGGYEMLYGGSERDDWPEYVPEAQIKVWCGEEQEIEWALLSRISLFWPEGARPAVDEKKFSVRWKGDGCYIGNNDTFRLLKVLVRADGRPVSHQDVADALDNPTMSPEAIRQAISRLRKALRRVKNACSELAAWIKTPDYGYVRFEKPCELEAAELSGQKLPPLEAFVNSQEDALFACPTHESPRESRKRQSS